MGVLVKALKILIVPLLFLALYPIQKELVGKWEDRFSSEIVYLPRGEYVRKIRFGWNGIMADMLWIRGFHYVQGQWQLIEAGHEKPKEGWHKQLPDLYDVITDLDPHFIPAYRGGALLLAALTKKPEAAIELLKKGVKENPTKYWELPYEIAVNYVFEHKDDPAAEAEARKWIEIASDKSRYPDITPQVPRMAAYLLSKEEDKPNRFDLAIDIWKEWEKSDSEEIKQVARQNILKYQRRKIVAELADAVKKFEKEKGRPPNDLDELVKEKIISEVPADPGGVLLFYLDPARKRVVAKPMDGAVRLKRSKGGSLTFQ